MLKLGTFRLPPRLETNKKPGNPARISGQTEEKNESTYEMKKMPHL
jgi:hypothetical protein